MKLGAQITPCKTGDEAQQNACTETSSSEGFRGGASGGGGGQNPIKGEPKPDTADSDGGEIDSQLADQIRDEWLQQQITGWTGHQKDEHGGDPFMTNAAAMGTLAVAQT